MAAIKIFANHYLCDANGDRDAAWPNGTIALVKDTTNGVVISQLSGGSFGFLYNYADAPANMLPVFSACAVYLGSYLANMVIPTQTGNNGKFLKTSGTNLSFETIAGGGDMLASNNLSDVLSANTARTNLGLNTTSNQTDSSDKRFMTDAQEAKLDSVASNANNYSHPNHTGDVTSTGDGSTVIGANKVLTAMVNTNAITNAKLAQVSTASIKGRTSASTGDPEDLTGAQARVIINVGGIPNNEIPNGITNGNTGEQSQTVVSATNYYITNSGITLPNPLKAGMVVGTKFVWRIWMSKTGAGTGVFQISIYRGTNGSTSDTQDVLQTIGTQTAAVDSMLVDITLTVTTTGGTGAYFWTMCPLNKAVTATGFGVATGTTGLFSGTVSSVAMNTASLIFGIGFKSTTGTPTIRIVQVQAQAINIS